VLKVQILGLHLIILKKIKIVMKKIKKKLIKVFNFGQCSFCKNVIPVERGLLNRKSRPRINEKTGLCTNCEKLGAIAQLGEHQTGSRLTP
jgi:hypothetical protein